MTKFTLFKAHPFFKHSAPAVWQQSWDQQWTVRWRDFWTIKQECEFATEKEARAFASTIGKPPITIDTDEEGSDEDLEACDRFWHEL